MNKLEKLIFERSVPGCNAYKVTNEDLSQVESYVSDFKRETFEFPEVPESDVMRHFLRLSHLNFSVDEGFYPLGSCTMKYNPKINERVSNFSGFLNTHPLLPQDLVQGNLEMMYDLEKYMAEIVGMDGVSLQPVAGASGELTGLKIMKAYHEKKNNKDKKYIIMPDSAHGTNPASASMAGFEVLEVPSDSRGGIDIEKLKELVTDEVAGFMVTNPNTLGLYDQNIEEISKIFHSVDALLYYDGANLNAIMGKVKPGDMGFDIVHVNIHKTFSTPHGGGGPGSGPVGVKQKLVEFLPVPRVIKNNDNFELDFNNEFSIGKVHSFYGNFGILVRAYAYIRMLGAEGLKKTSEMAVLNANYMMNKLKPHYYLQYDRTCMHEFVISAKKIKNDTGVSAMDVAKRLLDLGYHAPTMYFPLIVEEALMIEPTETENKADLDEFCDRLIKIKEECYSDSDGLHAAPETTFVGRVDEVTAARKPKTNYFLDKDIDD